MSHWCKHFNGVQHKVCRAGVCYDNVKVFNAPLGLGQGVSMPCTPDYNEAGATCDKAEYYTAAEERERDRKSRERICQVFTARAAIVEKIGKQRGVAGAIACPICKTGTLHYRVAGYNGHIAAKCETPECVQWIE